MKFEIKKATKKAAKLRAAFIGLSGGGKTWKSLALATALGQRIVVIDTERGSASKYANDFAFDVLELETFAPATYVEAIGACVAEGYEVIVIDSLSHAWMGKDGALETVDKIAKRQGGGSFNAWRDVTPMHNALVDTILRANAHVIVTMRAKTEFVQEKDERSGKTVVRKVGLAAVQRDGMEYEFDVVADVDQEHNAIITKTRCSALADAVIPPQSDALARTLKTWLTDGAPAEQASPPAPSAAPAAAAAPRSSTPSEPPPAPDAPATPGYPPEYAPFYSALDDIELPGEGVATWLKYRHLFAEAPVPAKEAAWKALVARVEKVGHMANAKVWLKKCIAEEEARRGIATEAPRVTTPDPSKPVTDARPVSSALSAFVTDVAAAASQAAVVSAWMRHRAGLSDDERGRAWVAGTQRIAALLNVPEARADVVFMEGVQECETDPGPPDDNGGAPAPGDAASSTTTKARGGKAKATAAAAQASARPAWLDDEIAFRTHVGEELTDVFHLSGSARKWGKLFNSAQVWLYALRYQQLRREMSPASLPPSVADCDIAVRGWINEGPKKSARRGDTRTCEVGP